MESQRKIKYKKLAVLVDSGVVLSDPDVVGEEEGSEFEDDSAGASTAIRSHKSIVGPDQLVPGEAELAPESPELKGFKALLMWLPAICDVSLCPSD